MTFSPWPCHTLGNPRNPPLVLLHGFLGRGGDFLPIAERLGERFFCLLPDLPGHGANTARDLDAPLNFPRLAEEFPRLLAAFDISACSLGGYSMGGRIALYLAHRFPRRVRALVVESANPGLEGDAARRARLEADRQRAALIRRIGIQAFLEQWYAMPLFASLGEHAEALRRIRAERARNDPRWMAKVIVELSPAAQPPLWEALPALSLPALLIAGKRDAKYAALMPRMAARMPRARQVIVEGAGHNVHLEQPALYAQLLNDWLTGRM